jgi:hypothetical protein
MLGSCCFSGRFRSEDNATLTVEGMEGTEQADNPSAEIPTADAAAARSPVAADDTDGRHPAPTEPAEPAGAGRWTTPTRR